MMAWILLYSDGMNFPQGGVAWMKNFCFWKDEPGENMATEAKREMRPKHFILIFSFCYLY